MNIRLSASMIGLSIFTSLTLVSINPANAQKNNGSDNGNNTHSISPCSCDHSHVTPVVKEAIKSVVIPDSVKPIFSTTLSTQEALRILPQILIPPNTSNVVLSESFNAIATSINGLIVDGNINLYQLRKAVAAYNKYVEELVKSVGGDEATAIIKKNSDLKNTLAALVDAVNKK
jgi:hypothetical protein